jgi:hypothetical protein
VKAIILPHPASIPRHLFVWRRKVKMDFVITHAGNRFTIWGESD